jgi:hypothetical protein
MAGRASPKPSVNAVKRRVLRINIPPGTDAVIPCFFAARSSSTWQTACHAGMICKRSHVFIRINTLRRRRRRCANALSPATGTSTQQCLRTNASIRAGPPGYTLRKQKLTARIRSDCECIAHATVQRDMSAFLHEISAALRMAISVPSPAGEGANAQISAFRSTYSCGLQDRRNWRLGE